MKATMEALERYDDEEIKSPEFNPNRKTLPTIPKTAVIGTIKH